MEMNKHLSKITLLAKKYRYAIVILLLGILLMVFPISSKSSREEVSHTATQPSATFSDISQELTQVLAQIEGVGQVKVMLTVATGEQTIYHYDEDITTNESGSSIRKDTVIITGADRDQQALISYVRPPTYLGAIIVCQGADQAAVKLSVIDAVSKITGLSSDKISVVKMK